MRVIFLCIFMFFSSLVVAESSGVALMPHIFKNSINETHIIVTNISSEPVTVNIELIDSSGKRYDESAENGDNIRLFQSFSADPVTASGAVLGPYETGRVQIYKGAEVRGFGKISWSSSADMQVALIAHVEQNYNNTPYMYSRHVFPVNSHLPF